MMSLPRHMAAGRSRGRSPARGGSLTRRGFVGASAATLVASCAGEGPAATAAEGMPRGDGTTLFLCGDVMPGRGIDQILPHPVDPLLREAFVTSARTYVELAERADGPIPRGVGPDYVWGDTLAMLAEVRPAARIVNLETSVTISDDFWPKAVNYRMAPRNAGLLSAAGIDCAVLANNHVLDFGREGLLETLATLREAGVPAAGAGIDRASAAAPVTIAAPDRRVVVHAYGSTTSGIPQQWAARPDRPGVNLLPDLGEATIERIVAEAGAMRGTGDLLIASIHWGGNWGYAIPPEQVRFAHGLIDGGFDAVHGHSSHHAKAIEIYRGRPILYGCGDFLTDYEGISGHEAFRGDLALAYLPRFAPAGLAAFRAVPFRMRRFRLERAPREDAAWLARRLDRESRRFATRVTLAPGDTLAVEPA